MASTITAFSHLKIPLEDVLKATNNFADENIISRGGFGKAYKGQLLHSGTLMDISARRLDRRYGLGDVEFWTEISLLSDLKHKNIVSIIGFCDEKNEKIIISRYDSNGSLVEHLNNPKLAWMQRLKICVGVARALSYLHHDEGRTYGVIHRNVSSYTILLDENWEAKLSGFEISLKQSASRMDQILPCEATGTEGYMDPTIGSTGGITYKSDIYSFGVILFEILCGRKAYNRNESNRFLAPLAKFHYENDTLYDIIHPDLLKQIDPGSGIKFSKVAYSCLIKERAYCPDMDQVVEKLERSLELQLPREKRIKNLEHLQLVIQEKNLEHLKIPLSDIKLATNDFSETHRIASTRYYMWYRTQLHYSRKGSHYSLEEKNKRELPNTHNTVIIKRIFATQDKEGEEMFFTEIDMLTTCKHHNIVTLLGFCKEASEMILVIEHLSNGYLGDYLRNNNHMPVLSWATRLKICLDVANGLKYLHYEMEGENVIIHRDIKSFNIALDENWRAKIGDFRLSVYLPPNQDDDAIHHNAYVGTLEYMDPEYKETGKLKRESDVYSFGVVLFEIFCGRLAFDKIYKEDIDKGLASVARRCFMKGTIKEMIDPSIKEESGENKFVANKRPNGDSLDIYLKIAYECVAQTQNQRPTMGVIIKELEKALFIQEEQEQSCDVGQVVDKLKKPLGQQLTPENPEKSRNAGEGTSGDNWKGKNLEHLKISLNDIKLATHNFSETYRIASGKFHIWYSAELQFNKENPYSIEEKKKGELPMRQNTVVIKRIIPREDKLGEHFFFTEIEMLTTCKHPNIVTLLGFCDEDSEMILVIENLPYRFLGGYLKDINDMPVTLTWARRLKICLDVAKGLNYLHYEMEDQKIIINRDINCNSIALDGNLRAKIADFMYSIFLPPNKDNDSFHTKFIFGKIEYIDPEYFMTAKLKRESDVYSFGVLMFEILCGRRATDTIYLKESNIGLADVARRCFNEGRLNDMIDPIIKEEIVENNFVLSRGPNKDSLDTFIQVAYECVAKTQEMRPTMKAVIKELEKALAFQENNKDYLRISLEEIKFATRNFDTQNCIGGGGFGKVFIGKVPNGDGFDTIVAKRLDTSGGQGEQQFLSELQILFEYKHDNIVRLLGYCAGNDEKIIVYEYESRGSLDRYLNDNRLTWMKRLKICVDVATALDFLHGGAGTQATVIHRDIKTANILLNADWKAKIADFGLSLISPINQETDYVIDHACGTRGYLDPLYLKSGFLTIESDIYSFGVVLFEILCGKSTFKINKYEGQFLPSFIKRMFEEGKHGEVVFEGIKEQIKSKSLATFQRIAYQCLEDDREKRPTAKEVLAQLMLAMEYQEDAEIWEPRLPKNYKEIFQMSKTPKIYCMEKKKDLYDMLSKGILLQNGKVWFSLGNNGERNEMISSTKFSFRNCRSYRWTFIETSRFPKVAKMIDISNLQIHIKIKTRFLSPCVSYGVHLVFKFCDIRKYTSERMYVNLNYKMGGESLHAYFATRRDQEWLMIELFRISVLKEDIDFEVLLESFSEYYCGSGTNMYFEGIEFRAIGNAKHEALKSNTNMDQGQEFPTNSGSTLKSSEYISLGEKPLSPSKLKGKTSFLLSAKEFLCDSSNEKFCYFKPSKHSRFQEVIELLSKRVFRIKCNIQSHMLSPNTDYMCYLVFKLSEKCSGLHCPVEVCDLLNQNKKETKVLYFRSPDSWNLHDINQVPKQREDGWMEVNVWKFNINYELKNECFLLNLKLRSYEGTMSGLIVCGLELRPM